MISAAPYSRAVATPAPVIAPDAPAALPPGVRREVRNGLLYIIGRDGIAQPCASERIGRIVAESVRNLGPVSR